MHPSKDRFLLETWCFCRQRKSTPKPREPSMSNTPLPTLPLGLASFPLLRQKGRLYVDKTDLLQKLIETGDYYFLSRPRRFGKSLTISTLEAMFREKVSSLLDLPQKTGSKKYPSIPALCSALISVPSIVLGIPRICATG